MRLGPDIIPSKKELSVLHSRGLKWISAAMLLSVCGAAAWKLHEHYLVSAAVSDLELAEAETGSSGDDERWRAISLRASVESVRGKHAVALSGYANSLRFAVDAVRTASSYRNIAYEAEKLDLLEVAERAYRLSLKLNADLLTQRCLADLLCKRSKYDAAEPLYRDLLAQARSQDEERGLKLSLFEVLNSTGRGKTPEAETLRTQAIGSYAK